MSRLGDFFAHLKSAIDFQQLPRPDRRLVFYSEGRNYWVHLEGLIKAFLKISDIPVCYISSGKDDPGLRFAHANYRTFRTDEGFIRNWLFENIDTDVMVMTMPDLHQYQVKRSRHDVHYVYVQHSLVSFHMVYRAGAFDHFDTLFCAGPHHLRETRALEKLNKLPAKRLVEHGYARLDAIRQEAARHPRDPASNPAIQHVLIAPSWGPQGTIESGICRGIVEQLLDAGYQVTFRPHPQTIKFAWPRVDEIVRRHQAHPRFAYEANVDGQDSLHASDVMLSDWSGAALDYAFGLNKPVLFVDVPRKVNNSDYQALGIEPIEVELRPLLGAVLTLDALDSCVDKLRELDRSGIRIDDPGRYVFNLGHCSEVGARALRDICEQG